MRACFLLAIASLLAIAPVRAQSPAPPKITETQVSASQIKLSFDQPMLTWEERSPLRAIAMQPEVPCTWYWEDDTTLLCRTAGHLKLFHVASAYRLRIDHGLWSQAGMELPPQSIVAESERPQLRSEVSDWKAGVPQIHLTTDAAVTAEAVARVIAVDLDGQPLRSRVEALPDEPPRVYATEHTFDLQLPDLPTREGVLHMRVHPGLVGSAGPLPGTQDEVLLTAAVHEPFRLRAVACNPDYWAKATPAVAGKPTPIACLPGQPIGLYFSRTPSDAAIAAIAAALPAGVTLIERKDVQDSWNYVSSSRDDPAERSPQAGVFVKADVAHADLRLSLPTRLTATDGAILADPVRIDLQLGDYPPAFELKPDVLVAPVGSTALPDLRTRNLGKDLSIDTLAIGADVQPAATTVRPSSTRNALQLASLPQAPATIREHGGLILAGARNERGVGYALAYAPFEVLASVGDGQLLVWASRWGDGSGLADATVELLDVDRNGRVQVIGTATTAADGVAQLAYVPPSHDYEIRDIPLLVRVRQGGQSSVVPLSLALYGEARPLIASDRRSATGERAWPHFADGAKHSFGVTDRPLYRPGDAVHYRVWYRRRDGNRLLRTDADKAQFVLRSPDRGKVLLRWQAALDAQGSVAGEVRLPELLPDDEYCIHGVSGGETSFDFDEDGACFQVTRYEAQALWAQIQPDHASVLAGQSLRLNLQAGYFSGDAAAAVAAQFSGLLTPRRVEDTFPAVSAYTFIAPFTGDDPRPGADPLRGLNVQATTDGKGRAQLQVQLPPSIDADEHKDHPIVFGLFEFNASVSIPGKASASSGTAQVRYAQYRATSA
ncbi:MAG: hypothetical protein JSR34_10280 [Proteobacteria bacterium]|nr:hypothetical protein [Pseudomonadota bacterium]